VGKDSTTTKPRQTADRRMISRPDRFVRYVSKLKTNTTAFHASSRMHREQADQLKKNLVTVRLGGSERSRKKHTDRGKLLVRDRIAKLSDRGSSFFEVAPFAAWEQHGYPLPAAGLVAGVAKICGRDVMVAANDATVKGGSYHPLTVKKHLRAQQIALENRLPCIYLVDSGGAYLPLQSEVFPDRDHFGRIFFNQAQLSAAGIPQLAAVMGSCTAGGAYVPAMSDEAIIVDGTGTIFLAGPPLVQAATGEVVTAEELGGGDVHSRISGVADYFAKDDEQAIFMLRQSVAALNGSGLTQLDRIKPEMPHYDPEDIYGVIPKDERQPYDAREIIARIVDGSRFSQFKARYGRTLVCAFTRIDGYLCGVIANNGVLFRESAEKGAHFIQLCGHRQIPIIFLQNITGFMVGKRAEHDGIARAGAKMVHALSTCGVPRFTVVIGGSHGAGNYGMCGRAYDPRFLWMWPNAKISVMGAQQAAFVMDRVGKRLKPGESEDQMQARAEEAKIRLLKRYEAQSDAYYSSAQIWDDGIIDPIMTRDVLARGLAVSLNAPFLRMQPGVFRM